MPDRSVTNLQDLIFYQYSKQIARSAFQVPDGTTAKGQHYGFIKKTFRDLKNGVKKWSDITREDWQFADSEKKCIYCGSTTNLQREHIVRKSLSINERCANCPHIQEIHNQVWACEDCNSKKGTLGVYEFYQKMDPGNPKFYDLVPSLLEKKYLKTIFRCHECAGTLSAQDLDGDGKTTVLDIDFIIH